MTITFVFTFSPLALQYLDLTRFYSFLLPFSDFQGDLGRQLSSFSSVFIPSISRWEKDTVTFSGDYGKRLKSFLLENHVF